MTLIRSQQLTATAPYADAAFTGAGQFVFTAGACPLDNGPPPADSSNAAHEYDVVWWIPSERTTGIQASLIMLGQRLGLKVTQEANAAVPLVLEALRARTSVPQLAPGLRQCGKP